MKAEESVIVADFAIFVHPLVLVFLSLLFFLQLAELNHLFLGILSRISDVDKCKKKAKSEFFSVFVIFFSLKSVW